MSQSPACALASMRILSAPSPPVCKCLLDCFSRYSLDLALKYISVLTVLHWRFSYHDGLKTESPTSLCLDQDQCMFWFCVFVLVVNTTCDWLTSLNKIPVKKEGKNYNSQNTLIRKQTITEWCVRRKESSRQERFDARSTFLNRRRGQTACAAVACAGFRQELRTGRQMLLSHWLLVGLGEFLQTQPITVNRYAEVAQIYCVFSSHSIGHHIVPEWPKLYIGRAILTFLTR